MGQLRSRALRVAVLLLGPTVLAAACGDDDETTTASEATTTTAAEDTAAPDDGGEGEAADAVTVTVGADGLEVPAEIPAGAVEVTVDGDVEEVDFTRVTDGTTEEAFVEGIASLLEGGPAPEFFLANSGAVVDSGSATSTILLEPGSYIVWAESSVDDEDGEEPTIVTAPVTVTGGGGAELPEAQNTITARDYEFEVDVTAGDGFVFRNEGPDQLHHAIIFNFGDLDPAVVEENLPAFLQSGEDAPPPPAFAELDFDSLEGGASAVFSPGLGGTAPGAFESGTTYVAVCFLSDLQGGPPHAMAYDMFEVFTVE
jgi:hypothetical protein